MAFLAGKMTRTSQFLSLFLSPRKLCSDVKPSLSGFGKFNKMINETKTITTTKEENTTFAKLLRHSKSIQLGDPQGKVVEGQIVHVVGEDLYIDFGGKFHSVCQVPLKNSREYVRGAKVRLRINELELSSKFLGANKEITLREADGIVLGIIRTPLRKST